jgi:hypothetical protein
MWKSTVSDRLDKWKSFRQSINNLPVEQALDAVAQFWIQAPFTPYYLDHERPDLWPDPWTLIEENYYCDLAKALGIVYTLYLSEHKGLELKLRIMKSSSKERIQYNLVFVDQEKYVLNLEHGEVVNKKSIPKDLELIIEYDRDSLKLDRF